MNSLFNRFGNMGRNGNQQQQNGNILSQLLQVQKNPGLILDILLNNGKINQQQYNELQPHRNDPQAICRYLINSGM